MKTNIKISIDESAFEVTQIERDFEAMDRQGLFSRKLSNEEQFKMM